jgi:ABC-type Fe3+-hydroxamate transport system substrate-binding protein
VQRGSVYEVNPDIYLRESPRLIDALEQLAQLLKRLSRN